MCQGNKSRQGNSNQKLTYKEQLREESEATPDEYLPALLQIIRLYLQSVALKPTVILP